ncbi:YbaB/EbfC family nucleoid-associated protein [Vallitalea pronyensis]|uniref:Nucleoid-associated protein HZI73_02515 n=1 Tax=Vallitalea pronyensis TaxID=1348613 RepID=A0A8J8SFD0_9FIRM|nr:YbaB/EbfC family nucleoid-associated protein [Vallitalea pronyensis]QUI21224.1 YbaB/EbfC family nucleoid-associated protein [Vallitalea pronyensis]
MAKRGGFGGGMPNNMNNLMKQAQKMQKKMQEMQEDLDTQVFEASAGGGAVKVVVSGKKEVTKVSIDPEVVDEDDVEMLEDLILAAVNEAMRTADEQVNQQMSKLTGGLNMPGGLF